MAKHHYASRPHDTPGMPPGIPFIIGNELAERFSFYGMKTILTVFMTKHLLDASGEAAYMSDEQAKSVYHLFSALAYFFPILGAIISDVLWGKYKTILLISLMYCLGHGMLALMDVGPALGIWDMKPFLYAGLLLIAIGAGGIKPCVSAHVGDQFGTKNKHLVSKTFSWFYFSINVGAATSSLLTPIFLAKFGPAVAFGVPGVLMVLATFVFWLGRNRFVHIKPAGWQQFQQETFSTEGKRALINLAPLFLIFIPVFWAIFDQTGSAWVLQAEAMNRRFFGVLWLESQIQAVNPILILILIPLFAYVIYPAIDKVFRMTPLRKIGIGLFLTVVAFTISALIERSIQAQSAEVAQNIFGAIGSPDAVVMTDLKGVLRAAAEFGWTQNELEPYLAGMPSIGWQLLAYLVLTAAEVMVSITSLEFAYTQAPRRMKSFVMGVYFLGVSLGNLFTSGVNAILAVFRDESGRTMLDGALYYWFFTGLMFVTALAFVFFSRFYKGSTFLQDDAGPDALTPEDEARAQAEAPDAR